MRRVKNILRAIAGLFLLAWIILFIAGYSETATVMIVLAGFSILIIIGVQVSNVYHGYFVKRRRDL